MPFDQFTIEQLAGDLLPNATLEQRVATGSSRNTLTNREGGMDLEMLRVEQTMDRTNTLGTVWLWRSTLHSPGGSPSWLVSLPIRTLCNEAGSCCSVAGGARCGKAGLSS